MAKTISEQSLSDPQGKFGRWFYDEHGLPAFEYTCDQEIDPAARYFTTQGEDTIHWHQLGNDRITAIATNRGEIQAIESSRGLQWLNYRDVSRRRPGAGIAIIADGNKTWNDLYEKGSPAAGYRRIFGAGYFRKISEREGLNCDNRIIVPFGDDPVIIEEIEITNNSNVRREFEFFCFNGINLHYMAIAWIYTTHKRKYFSPSETGNAIAGVLNRMISPAADSEDRRSSFADKFVFSPMIDDGGIAFVVPEFTAGRRPAAATPSSWNHYPESLFMAMFNDEPDKVFLDAEKIFDEKGCFMLENSGTSRKSRRIRRPCLCMGKKISLDPGEKKKLWFAFGYGKAADSAGLINKYRNIIEEKGSISELNAEKWRKSVPHFEIPGEPDNEWVSRETRWHGYYSRSAFLFDEFYKCHYTPQGGAYEYLHGLRGAVRDIAIFTVGILYIAPELARELLIYCFQQMRTSGRIMYAAHGYGKSTGVMVHEHPSDLHLFLFWSLTEYVFLTRDYRILDEAIPFCDRRESAGDIRSRIKTGLDYFYSRIGLGEHGLIRAGDGDWSDGISLFVKNRRVFLKKGESVFNSAMALYVLPRLADLVETWDSGAAAGAREYSAGLKKAVLDCFNGKWFFRGYDGEGRPVGDENLFLEHHTWLLISRILSEDSARSVVKNIFEKLDRPSSYGQYVLYPPKKSFLDQYAPGWDVNGGIWYAMDFLLSWGYGHYDPGKAWNAFRKNSMAAKAAVYPDIWYGVWSGPDSINADYADRPGETFFHLPTPGTDFPVMNLNLHAGFIMALVKLCGIEPGKDGVNVRPLLPFGKFKLSTPVLSLEVNDGQIDFRMKKETEK